MILCAFRVTFRTPVKMPTSRGTFSWQLFGLCCIGFQVVLFDMRWSVLYLWGYPRDRAVTSLYSLDLVQQYLQRTPRMTVRAVTALQDIDTWSITIWYKGSGLLPVTDCPTHFSLAACLVDGALTYQSANPNGAAFFDHNQNSSDVSLVPLEYSAVWLY